MMLRTIAAAALLLVTASPAWAYYPDDPSRGQLSAGYYSGNRGGWQDSGRTTSGPDRPSGWSWWSGSSTRQAVVGDGGRGWGGRDRPD